MLKFWRKRKNFAVHLVFWPIIAVFVIWGFERYGNPVGGAAAIVNNHSVSLGEYRNAVQRMVDFYTQVFQGNFDEKTQEQYHIKENALSQLVDTVLISDEADVMGLRPTDAEVRDTIVNDVNFKKDGKFSRDNYDAALKYLHLTASQFEDEERKGLMMSRINKLFEQNLAPTSLEVQKEKTLRSEKKNVEFIRLDKDQVTAKMNFSQTEIESFLKSDANLKDVREYFDLHQSEFSKPEEIHAVHILVKAKAGDVAEEKAAREKIDKIRSELTMSNFAELAKKYSDDPGSKVKGGELGWFGHGRMVPEFDKAAFSLAIGKVSDPVKTNFGYHLIKVLEKHPLTREDFDKVKPSIAQKFLAREKFDKTVAEAEKKFSSSPGEGVNSIQSLMGPKAKWEETGPFTLADETIPKLGENTELIGAAMAVSQSKPLFPKLIKEGSTYYVVRFKKSEPAPEVDEKTLAKSLASTTSRNVFDSWRTALREKATIKINPQLQNGGAEAPDTGDF